MNIGIIGSGNIGYAVAQLGARAQHAIALSNQRGPASLADAIQRLGPCVHATSVQEAVTFGDRVLLAMPFRAYTMLPSAQFRGKIVLDAMNYNPQRDGWIDFNAHTSSELVAAHLPGAQVVKTFNTLWSKTLETGAHPEKPLSERVAIFMAGDDALAKSVVEQFIEEIGFVSVDTGTLRNGGRLQEPGSIIYNREFDRIQAQERLAAMQGMIK
jgi:predicted dinucleotide-binding enzyme